MKRTRALALVAALAVVWLSRPAAANDAAGAPQSSLIRAGAVTLTTRIDRSTARVADPIELTLEVQAPANTKVELPVSPKQLGDFDVRASARFNDVPAGDSAGNRLWILKMTLDTLKTGTLTIPPLDVRLAATTESSGLKTVQTEPLQVQIASVLENRADPTKFRDIKSTVDVAVPVAHSFVWLGWTAAGLGTLLAGVVLVVIGRRRRRGPSAAEWAFAALADLAAKNLEPGTDAESVISEAVQIAREFCELEFGIPAVALTSQEFVAQVTKQAGLDYPAQDSLADLVSVADGVKFARLGVNREQARSALQRAMAFVKECERQRQSPGKESS